MSSLSDQSVSVWISLMRTSRGLLEEIENELKAEDLPPLSWYDALLEVERAGEAGIRPFELKDKLLLPQYGTSRLVDKIVKAGLLAREAVEDDGRGHRIVITGQGREMRRRMWPVYSRFLTSAIGDRLNDDEIKALVPLLNKLRPKNA